MSLVIKKHITLYVYIHLIALLGTVLLGLTIAYEWDLWLEFIFVPLTCLGVAMLYVAPLFVILIAYRAVSKKELEFIRFLCAEVAICLCQIFAFSLACQ